MIYTIPSLALFQLLVPITGLTVTTVEVALVGYTLLILFRNILAGLRAAPPEVLEAARGMGLTSTQTLWRVELPLALPAIVAGVRVAVVSTIALATVAAFVVAQGLGGPILGALRLDFKTEIITAGALADRAGDPRRRTARRRAAAADALGLRSEDGMILASALDVFVGGLEFIVDERALILEKTWEHLLLSAAGLAVSVAIAVPLGVVLGHLHRGSFVAINLANVGRALPTLVVIAFGLTSSGSASRTC